MHPAVQKLLAIAEAEIGYLHKASVASLDDKLANAGSLAYPKCTKYTRDLYAAGYYGFNAQGQDWCDVFVDWLFFKLCNEDKEKAEHVICQTGAGGACVGYSRGYFEAAGRLFDTPEVGDQLFLGGSHTGIVCDVDDNLNGDFTYYTIEGNTTQPSDFDWPNPTNACGVFKKKRRKSECSDLAFGRPRFDEVPITEHFFSLALTSVSATMATININIIKNFEESVLSAYSWHYCLTNLLTNKEEIVYLKDNKISYLPIKDIDAQTPYKLVISAEKNLDSISQQLIFFTPRELPPGFSRLSANFTVDKNLENIICDLDFKTTKTWNITKTQGYRVSLLVNGKVVDSRDDMTLSELSRVSLKDFSSDIEIHYDDIVQIGLQTWLKDINNNFLLNSPSPTCTQCVYLVHFFSKVNKLFIQIKDGFKQALTYMTG